MMEARPRARNIVDRVAMNGCMLNSSIKVPASRPNTAPMSSMMIHDQEGGHAGVRQLQADDCGDGHDSTDRQIDTTGRIGRVMATARIIR